jgi:CheY-like chemotaxis protein
MTPTSSLAKARSDRALILVVERDPHVRELERFFLEEGGYAVEFANDGAEGLARARELRPVILISEVLLPRMDGFSVCRALKADPLTRGTLVVLFSILSAEDRAREAGADAFLRKPLDDGLLGETVSRLLSRRDDR